MNMMKKRLDAVVLWVGMVFFAFPLWAQQESEPLAFDAFYKEGMEVTDGVLPVYREKSKIYLEVPAALLGREVEIAAQVNGGFDWIARPIKGMGVVRLEKGTDHTLCFRQDLYAERLLDEKSEFFKAFRASNKQPVEVQYPVVAYAKDGKGCIIEITDILENGDEWFEADFAKMRGLISGRSRVQGVHAFDAGVSFTVHRRYGCMLDQEMVAGTSVVLPMGSMPLEIGCVIRLLPEEGMRIRLASAKVGCYAVSFRDYTQNPYSVERDSLILRWNLGVAEKDAVAYRKGKLVEPLRPITFYVDSCCPPAYLAPIREGVLAWNRAFERAGFKHVLRVVRADRKIRLEEQRAVIAYDLGEAGVTGSYTAHPRTGEILSCRINIGHGFLPSELSTYLWQCGEVDSRIMRNPAHPEVATSILRSRVMKSVGKILGLRPNRAAASAYTAEQMRRTSWLAKQGYTASVTDENPYLYAIRPADHVPANCLFPQVGEYDCWAIGWAYREFPGSKNCYADRESLRGYLEARRPEHVYSAVGNQMQASGYALGKDPVEALAAGFGHLQFVCGNLEKVVYPEGQYDSGHQLNDISMQALPVYRNYLELAAECVVGLSDLKEQRQALDLLCRYFFSGGECCEVRMIRESLLADQRSRIIRCGENVFGILLSPAWMEKMAENEETGADAYTVELFFKELYQALFNGFDTEQAVAFRQRDVQLLFVRKWVELAEKEKIGEKGELGALLLAEEMRHFCHALEKAAAGQRDIRTAAFYRMLARYMVQHTVF